MPWPIPVALPGLHGINMFKNVYRGKKVLVTGHTGFKGAWLCQWLVCLGASVIGYSKDIPTDPSLFHILRMKKRVNHNIGDVRDLNSLHKLIEDVEPDFIFHLAAQPIVSEAFISPTETVSTNVLGTMNILEVLRHISRPCVAILITSDKCYENVEWLWGYKETDRIGGKDIYSGSKGAAELIIHSYLESFFYENHKVRVGIARAGNVIGGGDWAKDRIVVDAVKAWSRKESVKIRSPEATRPWQHVLEPLSGYLCLGAELYDNLRLNHEAFNFGPNTLYSPKVINLLQEMYDQWAEGLDEPFDPYVVIDNIPFHEAGLLKLNCEKAALLLNWSSTLTYKQTIEYVVSWYKNFYLKNSDMLAFTNSQIKDFEFMLTEQQQC